MMPEVTARTIITNNLKKKYDLPIIFFSFNEHSGMKGFRRRLIAFLEFIYDKRNQEIKRNAEFQAIGDRKIYLHYGDNFYNEYAQAIQTK